MARIDPHSYTDPAQGVVETLRWRFDVDFHKKRLIGEATLIFAEARAGDLDLDTRDLIISAVTGDKGSDLPFTLAESEGFMGAKLRIERPSEVKELTICYETTPNASALQWLAPANTAGAKHPFLFSQCQPIHARSMVPIQDSPKVRFGYEAEVTVPASLAAVMSAAPSEARVEDDKKIYSFSMPQPIPAYLLALAVGDITFRDLGPRTRVYAEPATLEAAAWEFSDVERMLEAAEGLFGPYLWDRFDFIVMPPAFPYGGMENPRLTFLTPTLIAGDRSLVNVLAHELAHSWTGNLVTNATMNDFWLNEGFTVWAERRILERLEGEAAVSLAAAIGRHALQADMERFGADSPFTQLETDLAGHDPDDVYSVVPYEKGFLFVVQLERDLGREAFDVWVRRYLEHFAFTSITTQEFEDFMEETQPGLLERVGGKAWIHGSGLPEDAPVFASEELAAIEAQADAWEAGGRPGIEVAKSWSAEKWQIFLQRLPRPLSRDDCAWLDGNFSLTVSNNSEVLSQWLNIVAASSYGPALPRLREFLSQVGRMKFLKPLYGALWNNQETKAMAREIFDASREAYHPIAQGVVNGMLS
ncbi:MAG: M1 family metallopeptidase [Deltaproteobacteria bacterium]|nr:M1 family metallopeptidase [Deltaproteobacteria bacterium]